jgi:hypothetical protein
MSQQPIYNRWVAITKSDTINFDASVSTTGANVVPCDAVYVGTAGTIALVTQDGTVAATSAAVGFIAGKFIRVNSTNTAAAGMFACYNV